MYARSLIIVVFAVQALTYKANAMPLGVDWNMEAPVVSHEEDTLTQQTFAVAEDRAFGTFRSGVYEHIYSSTNLTDWTEVLDIRSTNVIAVDNGVFVRSLDEGDSSVEYRFSRDGNEWMQWTSSDTPFTKRSGQAYSGFKGSVWLVSGKSAVPATPDVWRLSIGGEWEVMLEQTPWVDCARGTLVEFQNLLYFLGAPSNEDGARNAIWRSSDGMTWELVTEHAPWPSRYGGGAAVFENKLWLFGGVDARNADIRFNDLWVTQDGRNWTELPVNEPRLTRRFPILFAFNGQLHIAGSGIDHGATDLWSSPNGSDWTLWPYTASCYYRSLSGGVSFNGAMWLVGGEEASGLRDDVLRSTDGKNWERAVADAPWPSRRGHNVVVHEGALWLMGGEDRGQGITYNDVWRSTDGLDWQLVTASADWQPRYFAGVASKDGALWMMGGLTPDARLNDIWKSTDGVSWELVTAAAGWDPRGSFGCAARGGNLVVVGGAHFDEQGFQLYNNWDVWISADGESWERGPESVAPRDTPAMISYAGQLWLAGGFSNFGDEFSDEVFLNDVYTSLDGLHWHQVVESAPWEARRGHSLIGHDNKLWLIGGEGSTSISYRIGDVWSSSGTLIVHSTDLNRNGVIDLDELLRAIQFYNTPAGYHCAGQGEDSEDGYLPGFGADHSCAPHNTDYAPQDWTISLDELLRAIQFYNTIEGYHPCPEGEDGFCLGPA